MIICRARTAAKDGESRGREPVKNSLNVLRPLGLAWPSFLQEIPPSQIEHHTKMCLALKKKANLLRQENLIVEGSIVLLHFDNHIDAIEWLWAAILAGHLPVISTPLPNDPSQRTKLLIHLHAILNNPTVLTRSRLKTEFVCVEGLKVLSTDHTQARMRETFPTLRPLSRGTLDCCLSSHFSTLG